jgi:riboflavin synthase
MFTGIIEEIGKVARIGHKLDSISLTIKAKKVTGDLKEGDSIAINGACLTAVECMSDAFTVEVSPETLARSTLGKLQIGEAVNLERALKVGDRLGGHQVMGHIDGTGKIIALDKKGEFLDLTIQAPPDIMRYIIPKGSIAVDGISLTIASCKKDIIQVAVIPYTTKMTTLGQKQVGSEVNLEVDLIGKYIERFLIGIQEYQISDISKEIDKQFLAEHGFL